MGNWLTGYAHWLHLRWPAGTVERLPEVGDDGRSAVPGVYIVGDLSGIPLLKFALDGGARAVQAIDSDPAFQAERSGTMAPSPPAGGGTPPPIDLVIIGAGVSGLSAALEADRLGIRHELLEAAEPLATLVNFPKGKPIYTYPQEMTPAGRLQVSATVKEALVEELAGQTIEKGVRPRMARAEAVVREGGALSVRLADGAILRAHRVIVAIGRSGDFRMLGVPGEHLPKVYNRLHDPHDYTGQELLVVGGGDSALEAAIALAEAGGRVTLSYRGGSLSRPKPENVMSLGRLEASGMLTLRLGTQVREIRADQVDLVPAPGATGPPITLPNDTVFVMIGREAPLEFLRRSGLRLAGVMTPAGWTLMGLFLLFCTWLYNWKSGGAFGDLWYRNHWFPTNLGELTAGWGVPPESLAGITLKSAGGPSFWYTLAYSLLVVIFGVRRIRRRRTPYVTVQTVTLMAIQVVPLFLLPEVLLPWLNAHGALPRGLADALFPVVDYGHGREFWRAYGLILAWPLSVYNIFTDQPLWWWIGIGLVQTFVLIPLGIYYFGKGVYCGWICSCGALAETLGDTHRQKMPHGPGWNRLNMAGQAVLAVAFVLLGIRIAGWIWPASWAAQSFNGLKDHYKWIVDVGLAGIVGYGVYFWYSGRVWCRFLCPLAALMHIYARFSRFRILADKKKCISCNVCTSVCHQGIDVMNFANKGEAMADPECVRCSACVQMCPTGVLTFGQVDRSGRVVARDRLAASPVQLREGK